MSTAWACDVLCCVVAVVRTTARPYSVAATGFVHCGIVYSNTPFHECNGSCLAPWPPFEVCDCRFGKNIPKKSEGKVRVLSELPCIGTLPPLAFPILLLLSCGTLYSPVVRLPIGHPLWSALVPAPSSAVQPAGRSSLCGSFCRLCVGRYHLGGGDVGVGAVGGGGGGA